MARLKIEEIIKKIDNFKIVYYKDEGSYKEHLFNFNNLNIKLIFFFFPLSPNLSIHVIKQKDYTYEIKLHKKEKKSLLKPFIKKAKEWKKKNKDITIFDIETEKEQNELLKSINLEEKK